MRDITVAAVAFALFVGFAAVALSTFWVPSRPEAFLWLAITAAVAWPAARIAPVPAMLLIAGFTSAPWMWVGIESEIRIVPLVVVAFRSAQLGCRKRFVVPVVAVATPLILGINYLVGDATFSRLLHFGPQYQGYFDVEAGPRAWWDDLSSLLMQAVAVTAVVALGFILHRQQEMAANVHAQNAELISLRAAEVERAESEVRTSIARDVHDVVAHHVVAMIVTAQTADRVGNPDPEDLRSTMRSIAAEGDEALSAMRRVVKMLRSPSDDAGELGEFRNELLSLADRVAGNGLSVDIKGELAGTTKFVESTVLRITQEALTNVMFHSDADYVAISFTAVDEDVEIRIQNNGHSITRAQPRHGGNGIPGMRERARAVGGTFSAGPTPDGGWAVTAVLPRAGSLAVT